jgi:predicted DNA-binding transcriptional regulator YafY
MSRGQREGQWLVVRRCLAILRRVQRGPATRQELLQAMLDQERAEEARGETGGSAPRRRLEKDLYRIREYLQVDLGFDRRVGEYTIREAWQPLLDLPDGDLATIAWLEDTFAPDSPQHDEVHALLGRLRSFLSPERRGEIERQRTALTVDLRRRDEGRIRPAVQEGLTKALAQRRRVEFYYLSSQQADGVPRRHVVDPYDRYFDTVRGHYYLRGWCYYSDGPVGRYDQNKYVTYRLDRIREIQVLSLRLPPFPPRPPRHEVAYELAPPVARLGNITRHRGIEVRAIERREDGSAVVRGQTDSVFWAVRTLLHYGANCRVLGGAEMVREMTRVVREIAEIYAENILPPVNRGKG